MALPITDFIIERLLEYDPRFDVGGGIATTALMINPLSVILQPLRDELDEIQKNQSILSILESDDPDAFDEEIVDALASNVFITRKTGNKSSGTVRVRYFSPTSVDFGVGLATFLSTGSVRFVNVNPVSISESQMSLNVDGSLYYVDIPCEAETEGEDGNIDPGGIQTFENEPANVANVTNIYAFASGVDRETNLELINRIEVAVTVRALVTGRGIITTMMDNFSSIEEINPRGFGDPEMQRDIVYNTHIGGNVDVWVKTPSFVSSTYDTLAIVPDTTRRARAQSTVVMEQAAPTQYLLGFGSIDRTEVVPSAKTPDGFMGFVEGSDYILTDLSGAISRVASGNILHITDGIGSNATIANDAFGKTKVLTDSLSPFTDAHPGMQLHITSPSTVAGYYSIKSATSGALTIIGTFPPGTVGTTNVRYSLDDVVTVTFDYNPLSIDIIATTRTGRSNATINDVPLMKISKIEILDPTTAEPTGVFLDSTGGFGQGGYGVGPYGVGTAADYVLRVVIPNLRYSASEDNYIDIKKFYLGYSLRVYYEHETNVKSYQDFVDDPQNRVETALLKVKHFIPVYVNTASSIKYKVKSSNSSAKTGDEVQDLVESLVEDTKIGYSIEISDIVDLLYNSGADSVDLNISLRGEIHHTDGSVEYTDSTTEGFLTIPTNFTGVPLPDTDKPLSPQIAHFIPGAISLNRVMI